MKQVFTVLGMFTMLALANAATAGSTDEVKCVSTKHQYADIWDTRCSGQVTVPLWSGDAHTAPKITLPGGYECKRRHYRDLNVAKTTCRR